MATTERTPQESDSGAEQLFERQLHAAGLENLMPRVKEWVRNNPGAQEQIAHLAEMNFGNQVRNESDEGEAQLRLTEVFTEKAAADNSSQAEQSGQDAVTSTVTNSLRSAGKQRAIRTAIHTNRPKESRTAGIANITKHPDFEFWGRKALASGAIAATAAGVLGGIYLATDATHDGQKASAHSTSLNLNLADNHQNQPQSSLETTHDFFNLQDPSDQVGRVGNDFGPASQSGRNGDHQGMLTDWSRLFRGQKDGASIMTIYLSEAHVAGAPVKPSDEQLHDPAVYAEYMNEIEAYAAQLQNNPQLRVEQYNHLMTLLGNAHIGDLKQFPADVASWGVWKETSNDNRLDHTFLDLSVNEHNYGAEYREVTIVDESGNVITVIKVKWDCGLQPATENAHPLATQTPLPESWVPETPIAPQQPVESTPATTVVPPTEQTPPPTTTAPPPTTTIVPPPMAPKSPNITDYQRPGTDNTTDSGIGIKAPVTAAPTPQLAPPLVEQQVQVPPANQLPNLNAPNLTIHDTPGSPLPITGPGLTGGRSTGIGSPGIPLKIPGLNNGDPGLPK